MPINQQLVYVQQEEQEEELDEQLKRYIKLLKKLGLLPSLDKKGLVPTYAYHCNRCNHMWFPKDYYATFQKEKGALISKNLIYKKPPKACARCKSEYWNKEPKRKTGHTKKETLIKSQHKLRSQEPDKMGLFGHDMLTKKRIEAEIRSLNKGLAESEKRQEFIKRMLKKRGIDIPI